MDKQLLVANHAKMTANLSPSRQENSSGLKDLKDEFARWPIFNKEIDHTVEIWATAKDFNISPELETQLEELIDKTGFLSKDRPGDFHILKRGAISISHIDGSDAAAWGQGRRPDKSLGPFVDLHGRLELYTSSFNAASSHFLLWDKTEKRCSAPIKLLKNYSINYSCSAVDELKMISAYLVLPIT